MPRWLPEVTRVEALDGTSVRLALTVNDDLAYFAGHFEGLPILPGVVMLDWAVRFARLHLRGFAPAATAAFAMKQVKFLSVVRPSDALELQLDWNAGASTGTGRLVFSFTRAVQVCASGQLVWTPSA